MMKLLDMSIKQLQTALLDGSITCVEIVKTYLKQIKSVDHDIRAYLYVDTKGALEKAEEIDKKIKLKEPLGDLFGVPIGIKDNIVTESMPTTCGSRMLEHYYSPFTATIVKKVEAADGIILGKLNLDEFAMGSTTENSYYQTTKNPHNTKRVPGGSSGGSAAAVASKQALITLGSDTGGSIRQPAAFCGVVGLKPSYGRISRYGLVAFASSLDQIGPLGRSVEDVAYTLSSLFGYDPLDSTSSSTVVDVYTDYLSRPLEGLKVAVTSAYKEDAVQPAIKESIIKTIQTLKELGCLVTEIEMEKIKKALPAYYILSSAEASSNLARFDGIRYGFRPQGKFELKDLYETARSQGFGREVKRRILLGTYALSSGYYDAYYKKAQQVRTLIKAEFDKTFSDFDLILTPTTPTTAYELGRKVEDPVEMYMGDIFTVPVNIAGLPAISLPAGKDQDDMPIGVQLISPLNEEKILIQVAHALERSSHD
jgi:aspartyl-tRNA(Asn)/glutamyl-tRNA(Gln) amidotransferase subunit A